MVSAAGHISGGHFNPAITFGALIGRHISWRNAALYWIAQLLGALVAATMLVGIFPASQWRGTLLGTPVLGPRVDVVTGVLIEAILTFFLVFVVYGTAIDPRSSFRAGGLAIGLTITLDILMGGPLTGAAMNPVRWFGPAMVSGTLDNAFVWSVGPLLGGAVAGLLYGHVLLERTTAERPRDA